MRLRSLASLRKLIKQTQGGVFFSTGYRDGELPILAGSAMGKVDGSHIDHLQYLTRTKGDLESHRKPNWTDKAEDEANTNLLPAQRHPSVLAAEAVSSLAHIDRFSGVLPKEIEGPMPAVAINCLYQVRQILLRAAVHTEHTELAYIDLTRGQLYVSLPFDDVPKKMIKRLSIPADDRLAAPPDRNRTGIFESPVLMTIAKGVVVGFIHVKGIEDLRISEPLKTECRKWGTERSRVDGSQIGLRIDSADLVNQIVVQDIEIKKCHPN